MNIKEFVNLISEETIAKNVRQRHDLAVIRYSRNSTIVSDFNEFKTVIMEYYLYHMKCVHGDYSKSAYNIYGEVKHLLCRSFGSMDNAYHEALTGVNGGLVVIFRAICDNLIREEEEMYLSEIIDRYVAPLDTKKKKELIRAYLDEYCDSTTAKTCDVDIMSENFKDFVDAIRKSRAILTSKAKMI